MPKISKRIQTSTSEDNNDKPSLNGSVLSRLSFLFARITDVDDTFLEEAKDQVSGELKPKFCDNYEVVRASWQKAMVWLDGLDISFSVMLASILSTKMPGDQLWVKILGPPACGKSTLCEAVSTSKRFVIAKSTIRGFHSGFGEGEEDYSLISKLNYRTLVLKDGDTLLQSPNLSQILSEGRDAYDGVSRTSYRNQNSRDYENLRFTWILCGTSSLRSLDNSELGERFLDCVIMDEIPDKLEDEILLRVCARAFGNAATVSDSDAPQSNFDSATTTAMQLTGGYVEFLRDNADSLTNGVVVDSKDVLRIAKLAKFVSRMRARPSTRQDEEVQREMASRLSSQLCRLAMCLAAVMNSHSIDKEVMRRVRKVALDTSRGISVELAEKMYEAGDLGVDPKSLCLVMPYPEDRLRQLLNFLTHKRLGVAEKFQPKRNGVRKAVRYRLTESFTQLYRDVFGS